MTLEAIFRPGSVAVVGASSSPEKWGFKILKHIIEAGFRGPIYPINPKGGEILGLKCFPTLTAVEGTIDLAAIIIPAPLVPEAIKDCGKKGVKAAVVITGGFSEAGGLLLDLKGKEEVRETYRRILERVKAFHPEATRECVLVTKMAEPGYAKGCTTCDTTSPCLTPQSATPRDGPQPPAQRY